MTTEACGPLKATVSKSLANNSGTDPYAYCRYRGGSAFGETFGKCLDCMRPDMEHGYVANCTSFPLLFSTILHTTLVKYTDTGCRLCCLGSWLRAASRRPRLPLA